MADGEGEGDPREMTPNKSSQDCDQDSRSPPSNTGGSWGHSGLENGTNGYVKSDEDSTDDLQETPLDFSVKKGAIPVQNLYNKLTNGLYKHYQDHNRSRNNHHKEDHHHQQQHFETTSEKVSHRENVIKTEAISPPPRANGLLPETKHSRKTSAYSPGDKIGEPQLALPGMLPRSLLSGDAAGLLPMIPPGLLPASGIFNGLPMQQEANGVKQSQNGKSQRPFKAYSKDQINLPMPFGALPALPQLPGLDMLTAQALTANSEEAFKQYKQYITALQEQMYAAQKSPSGSSTSSSHSNMHSGSMTSVHSPTNSGIEGTPVPATNWSLPMSTGSFTVPTSPESTVRSLYTPRQGSTRKRGRTLPEDQKDDAYWERRRKNNEAAKRSRDTRRAKEDEIAIRAAFLEQENLKLRVEVTALKNETAKLRCMLYNS